MVFAVVWLHTQSVFSYCCWSAWFCWFLIISLAQASPAQLISASSVTPETAGVKAEGWICLDRFRNTHQTSLRWDWDKTLCSEREECQFGFLTCLCSIYYSVFIYILVYVYFILIFVLCIIYSSIISWLIEFDGIDFAKYFHKDMSTSLFGKRGCRWLLGCGLP